jgi:hypothetical protein
VTSISVIAVALAAAITAPQEFPAQLPTRTLAEHEFIIPRDLPARPTLLVVGFSRASRVHAAEWRPRIAQHPVLSPILATYQVAVLEDVPSLFRGFVIAGIRHDVPELMQETFLIAVQDAAAWKTAVSFTDEDEAYILLLGSDHHVLWRSQGEPTNEALEAIQNQVVRLKTYP